MKVLSERTWGARKWVVALAALLVLIWLGISWKSGNSPFVVDTSSSLEQVLRSLSAPTPSVPDMPEVLKRLTPQPFSEKAVGSAAVLESLTPKKY